MSFGARVRIRQEALQHNLRVVRRHSGRARIMAVVKANAYGHGLLVAAAAFADADALAVARIPEARQLREAGITLPIVVLGGIFSPADVAIAADLDLEIVVHDAMQLEWLAAEGRRLGVVWVDIETGMNRLGIDPARVPDAVARLGPHTGEIRLMTQLSSADDRQDPATLRQLEAFLELAATFDGALALANSAGVLGWGEEFAARVPALLGERAWVRAGLALYGISPFAGTTGADFGLRPAMTFESSLVAVKALRAGERVGYNGTWRAEHDTVLGIVSAGYGDGYSRDIPAGTPVLVGSRRVPVVGRIAMDLTAIDLGPDNESRVGDPVVLWGERLPVEEIARAAGTIPYTLVTGITRREAAIVE